MKSLFRRGQSRTARDAPVPVAPVRQVGLPETWADVARSDLGGWADAIDRIYSGSLDGLLIRNVIEPNDLAAAVSAVERHRNEFVDHGKQIMYGTALVGADDDRTDYFADAWRINSRLGEFFGFDFCERIGDVLSTVGAGRPWAVPSEGPGRDYVPATFRFLPPDRGVMHAHTANEFCGVWSAYSFLRSTARMWNSLSYFVVAEKPDVGGELALYDLGWDDTPDDVRELSMSEERDIRLDRFEQHLVVPEVGDMILFTGGRVWHRVSPVFGPNRRVTVGGFVAISDDDREVLFWS